MVQTYQELNQFLQELKQRPSKPTLLLHSCCGPCSTAVLEKLSDVFDITIFFYNPNIYPEAEYRHRVQEQMKVLHLLKKDIHFVEGTYQYAIYQKAIEGLESLPERSKRCYACYQFRLNETKHRAIQQGFDYFTTTLSISPHKNSIWINEIGSSLETKKLGFLYSNFKKEDGYKRSIELSNQYDIYRQEYCGCEYSYEAYVKKAATKQE